MGITDWISLSGGNPSNIALFLGKKALSSEFAKTAIIKTLGKQTKPSIIAPSKDTILKSNLEKKYANPDNISGFLNKYASPHLFHS